MTMGRAQHAQLTEVADTAGTPNAVDVLLNITGQIKINDMLHI